MGSEMCIRDRKTPALKQYARFKTFVRDYIAHEQQHAPLELLCFTSKFASFVVSATGVCRKVLRWFLQWLQQKLFASAGVCGVSVGLVQHFCELLWGFWRRKVGAVREKASAANFGRQFFCKTK